MSDLIKGNLIKGKLTIQNSNGSGTAVLLDGNALPQGGTFHVTKPDDLVAKEPGAGDHFITGQIDIKDSAGNVLLSLIPTTIGGWIRVQQEGGIMLMGGKTDEKRIELNASERSLTIHTGALAGQRPTQIKLDGANGVIANGRMKLMANGEIEIPRSMRLEKGRMRLGAEPDGQGDAGGLIICNSDGKVVIELDAAERTLHVLDNLKLDKGALRLGSEPNGGGEEGGLLLRNSKGEKTVQLSAGVIELNDNNIEMIRLDGKSRIVKIHDQLIFENGVLRLGSGSGTNGRLQLRKANGGDTFTLDGSSAQMSVGGHGAAGRIVMRNQNGAETLRIDGQTGDVILQNADCAEDFDLAAVEICVPGAVMTLDKQGQLQQCRQQYDSAVVGVISGAGDYRPGIVLDRRPSDNPRAPVAMVGKVFCQVDASFGAIAPGDLLTTSSTPGHAMRVGERGRAVGAVLGKALGELTNGQGLIPIIVALQ